MPHPYRPVSLLLQRPHPGAELILNLRLLEYAAKLAPVRGKSTTRFFAPLTPVRTVPKRVSGRTIYGRVGAVHPRCVLSSLPPIYRGMREACISVFSPRPVVPANGPAAQRSIGRRPPRGIEHAARLPTAPTTALEMQTAQA